MYKNNLQTEDKPSAFITVNKKRVKQFFKDVYLADQTEFQIELFNPTTIKVLAEIALDGKPISNSGIIIRPGQRIFLERFIDNDRKFKFETYEVNNTNEVKNAIRNNGDVTIKFYRERIITHTPQLNFTYTGGIGTTNPYYFTGTTNSDYFDGN